MKEIEKIVFAAHFAFYFNNPKASDEAWYAAGKAVLAFRHEAQRELVVGDTVAEADLQEILRIMARHARTFLDEVAL